MDLHRRAIERVRQAAKARRTDAVSETDGESDREQERELGRVQEALSERGPTPGEDEPE
jgi:hypothetical protein